MEKIVWRGSRQDALDLLAAIDRHCTCVIDEAGVRYTSCPAHRMLVDDQRALDGFLFARSLVRRLRREEWGDTALHPYQFTPTPRTAQSVEEFLSVCRAEPDVATHHLRSGYFEPWLTDVGRADLAALAAQHRAAEIHQFLRVATAA